MQYSQCTPEQRVAIFNDRIEELERQHVERDITITELRGRINIATQKKDKLKIENYGVCLEEALREQEEVEQVIRLTVAERDEVIKQGM
ncbi:MAG: hypothetical protein JNJ94_12630 [Chlorobi bacterium]|nr:hypothetical protein [Chlorobiota bacterium]